MSKTQALDWAQHQSRYRWCRIGRTALPSSTQIFYFCIQSSSRRCKSSELIHVPWKGPSRKWHPPHFIGQNSVTHDHQSAKEFGESLACSARWVCASQKVAMKGNRMGGRILVDMDVETYGGWNDGSKQEQPSTQKRSALGVLEKSSSDTEAKAGRTQGVPRTYSLWNSFLFIS